MTKNSFLAEVTCKHKMLTMDNYFEVPFMSLAIVEPFQSDVVFHIETSQKTVFYMKFNTGLKMGELDGPEI